MTVDQPEELTPRQSCYYLRKHNSRAGYRQSNTVGQHWRLVLDTDTQCLHDPRRRSNILDLDSIICVGYQACELLLTTRS